MYYKVMKNNKVIDVLDDLIYLKWDSKHKIMVLCCESDAQAILLSDKNTICHEVSLYDIPTEAKFYDSVSVEEIDQYEYKQLKVLNMKTPQEITDELILYLINNGII